MKNWQGGVNPIKQESHGTSSVGFMLIESIDTFPRLLRAEIFAFFQEDESRNQMPALFIAAHDIEPHAFLNITLG